ncbi:rhomboid family intramembrane serine protease [Candidatus Dojkabacteria bacterium]|uniref:Rhomboid family intramembrane serine protease n=1 Tax=Candidatus Dojkabacteria bacterium TaxID=2099670 RepID=A0A952AKX6_9BACT|nr:rhomboid family intramembrane serine protease [Candidatus Dojkabacteria bacterium]
MSSFVSNIKITHVLVAINIIVYILTVAFSFFFWGNTNVFSSDTRTLYIFGAEHLPSILSGQVWRLVLPAFLHGSLIHLALNMYVLFGLGEAIEIFYGRRKLLAVYVLSAFFGSIASVVVSLVGAFSTGGAITVYPISVGASGAVFGLIGLLLGNSYKNDDYNPRIPVNVSGLWFFVIINLMFGFGFNVVGSDFSINNAAHIGGLLSGIVLGLLFSTKNNFYQGKISKIIESFLVAFSVVLVIFSIVLHIFFFN